MRGALHLFLRQQTLQSAIHALDAAFRAHGKHASGNTFENRLSETAAVLELAAQKAGWTSAPLAKGRGRGIAVAEAFKTFVAQVVEIRVEESGRIKVERVSHILTGAGRCAYRVIAAQ